MICAGELLEVTKRIFWFGTPEEALESPLRFLTYAMTYASDEDIETIRRYFTDDDFKAALDNPAPGIFDQSSWDKWNRRYGRIPIPALPKRRIPGVDPATVDDLFPQNPEKLDYPRKSSESLLPDRNGFVGIKQNRGTTSIPGGSPSSVGSSSTELLLGAVTFAVVLALGFPFVLALVLIVVGSWVLVLIFLLILKLAQIRTRVARGRGALVGALFLCSSRNGQQENKYH